MVFPLIEYNLPCEDDTVQLAQRLAGCLVYPLICTFEGEIGAGKTTFIRAMLRALGVTTAIKSPTFALVESYQVDERVIHHFDLYRLHDEVELDYLGFRDYFENNALICIEWPACARHYLDTVDLHIRLVTKDEGRLLLLQAHTPRGLAILATLETGV